MTYEEAIKELSVNCSNEMIKNAMGKLTAEYLLDKDGDKDFTKRLAISALQKQLPKKPFLKDYVEWCVCPVWETLVTCDCSVFNFCPHCGQAIDWSDEEE